MAVQDVEKSFLSWGSPDGKLVHPAETMQQMLEHVRHHKVNIDGNVCTVMVTTLVLEVMSLFSATYNLKEHRCF